MNKIKEFLKINYKELIAVILLSLFFYLNICKIGISVHDSLRNICFARSGYYMDIITWERWGVILLNQFPAYIQACCKTIWGYHLFTLVSVLLACLCCAWYFSRKTDRNLFWFFLIIFFLFAQFENDHDGLYSFHFMYQLSPFFIFLSLGLYDKYLETKRKIFLIASSILYLTASMIYEMYILFGIIFFIIDLAYYIKNKRVKIISLFKDLSLHALLVILYVISYLIVSSITGINNGDASIGKGITIKEILYTCWKLMIGMFPLNYFKLSNLYEYYSNYTLQINDILRWIFFSLLIILCLNNIKKFKCISLKKYIFISIICVFGAFFSGILCALTNKYIDWICYQNVRSFGTAYYAYFFIITWICISLALLYQKVKHKKAALIVIGFVMIIISELTFISNSSYIKQAEKNEKKYELFCEMIESDYFSTIDTDAQIYMPEYIGIHYQMQWLSRYANIIADLNITMINNEEDIDFTKDVYIWVYDDINEAIYLSKINEYYYCNEIYIVSAHSLDGYGASATKIWNDDYLYINGYLTSLCITIMNIDNFNIDDNAAIVTCNGMEFDTFCIRPVTYAEVDDGIVSTYGIYSEENWGAWAKPNVTLIFDNIPKYDKLDFSLSVATPGEENSSITISCNGKKEIFDVSGTTNILYTFPLKEGLNEIYIFSNAQNLIVESDTRDLNMQITNLSLSNNDNLIWSYFSTDMDNDRIYYPIYHLGTIVDFTMSDSVDKKLSLSGVSIPEEGFAWTNGNILNIGFDCNRDKKVNIRIATAQTFNGSQEVIVSANNFEIGKFTLIGEDEINFEVMPSKAGFVNLSIELPNAVSPQSLGQSDDSRVLALMLKSFICTEE